MSANVFAFPSRGKGPQPWTNDELAELYRVVDLLGRAGLAVATDMGMSDEGDPWFVFCRVDNDEVIAHFARIDGIFVAASIAVDETFRGANFRQIVDSMISAQPLVMPRPTPGSKLFMHPAVMLTAFIATALAHSEKMLAQNLLHSVEAQWDHGKAAVAHELKQIKTGWIDTLNGLMKLPLSDGKVGHDTGKEGLNLTLTSLIAIAIAALQPIAEKVAVLAQIVADELPGHGADAHAAAAAHAWQVALDESLPIVSAESGNNGADHGGDGTGDTAQLHKMDISADSAMIDSQKTVNDSVHLAGAQMVQKAVADDAVVHTPAPVIEAAVADLAASLVTQQKAIASAQSPVETFAIHVDAGLVTQTIAITDVTAEALQLLHLVPNSGGDSSKSVSNTDTPSSTDAATGAGTQSQTSSSGSDTHDQTQATTPSSPTVAATSPVSGTDPAVVVTPSQPTGDQTLDTSAVSGATVIQAISDFANNTSHLVAQQAITITAALTQELQSYFNGSTSLKLVFFESTTAVSDVFSFSPGVVFVNEKDVSPLAHLVNAGGTLTLDEPGGFVTLVGVATIDHTVA